MGEEGLRKARAAPQGKAADYRMDEVELDPEAELAVVIGASGQLPASPD